MHDDVARVERRVARFVAERLRPAVYRRQHPLTVSSWDTPGEPVDFATASAAAYEPCSPGQSWGRPWGTTWFRLAGEAPDGWAVDDGLLSEIVVDLGFGGTQPGFSAEATAYAADGAVIKGLHPRNRHLPLRPDGPVNLFLEASANPDVAAGLNFAPTPMGDLATAGTEPQYRFGGAWLAELDLAVWELIQDVDTLRGLMPELPIGSPRRAMVLRALDDMVDAVEPRDVAGTAAAGREVLAEVLRQPAYPSAHRVMAVGHAHIDSAWLWPVRETARKCARTFANVLSLMEEDPDLIFACSSAQQYAWVRDSYPELFERIRRRVADGRFVPVGGMWVESDTNMPGGEALVRQFVAGQRFFADEFGVECQEAWLPDSFGYTAALPQIARLAGIRWFLTQKTSWNETNRMPHHTFWWEGIDGSRLFTHFPPVDTYNSDLSGRELARAERGFAEKGRANSSMVPFGWGDGGGGPTREMLAAARRARSLEGSPTVEIASPVTFFAAAEAEYASPPEWSGELYLEFHRGTYTSQARTKRGNRRSEHLLREAELWATTAYLRHGEDYPYDELERAWHTVLLQQFHDILPGSSIAWVYQDADSGYAEVRRAAEEIIGRASRTLAGTGSIRLTFNAAPYALAGVSALGAGPRTEAAGAAVTDSTDGIVLENGRVRVVVDDRGLLTSVFDLEADRELLPVGATGNLLQLHRDTPAQWDAWDLDDHYRRSVVDLTDVAGMEVLEKGPERVAVRVRRRFGDSAVEQVITLAGGAKTIEIETTVDWHERQRLLKLAFPLDLHADHAASEIQFGHVNRAIHTNTSWDSARFETCAHRWVHVGEAGYGAAVANDSTYGHDITRSSRTGRVATTVRLSLLRAPLFPDPEADQGEHTMRCSLVVGADIADAVQEGYRLNLPPREVDGAGPVEPLLTVDHPAIVVEAVKLAEDRSGDVIVRLYEAYGGRARGRLHPSFAVSTVIETGVLERPLEDATALRTAADAVADGIDLELRPFQIVTLRLTRP
ncbi:MAG TPA: glycoside hydrolase family 38 C-terminal domain-containing protein [Propionibacteriaceae bacterium]|nr:glycoside hydrolase family 38 C-terminal domain-containing protein [Propionibacteriaceae bacterium]